ncbi:MAG: hypothetical protein LBG27_12345 [Spirochaetaceae bacterium]|jgi:hypothetical protein|nr:hypothetical protein [Spirochaetaceae bacterium]
MNVSVAMKSLKPYSPAQWLTEVQSLLETSCRNRTLPYARDTPLPHNTDVVRNTHCNDINTQTIELKAASIGIERTAWVFGADAEFLGLALRKPEENGPFDPDPVLWFAHIASRPETPVEAQTVYLIDQFTGESLNRLASYAREGPIENYEARGDEEARKRRCLIAQRVLFALHNYDSGLSDTAVHRSRQQAMRENTTPGTAGFPVSRKYYIAASNSLGKTQKQLFNIMLNYRSVQNTGTWNIDWNNGKKPEQLYDSMRELIANIRKTARTLFNAQMAAHVLSSPLHENTVKLPPAAMRLFTGTGELLSREKAASPERKNGGRQL